MRFRGGGVGHTGTRMATDKFLQDRDQLDLENGPTHSGDDEDEGAEGGEPEGSNSEAIGGALDPRNEGGDDNDSENEPQAGGDGDLGDSDDGDPDFEGNGDEEEDYGYGYAISDEEEDDGDVLDATEDVLGPEDGEGDIDEVNLLGFAAF